ncbi:MAG: hypothetical protein ACW98K_00020 [Candidatus Kariarchaeaceae archaeon]|jgi:hypothetical protein
MSICLTPRSLKLFGTYFKKHLPKILENSRTYEDVIKGLYGKALVDFKGDPKLERESGLKNNDIILQHLSIAPQLIGEYLMTDNQLKLDDILNKAIEERRTVQSAVDSNNLEGIQSVFDSLSQMIGGKEVHVNEGLVITSFDAGRLTLGSTTNQQAIQNPKTGKFRDNIDDPAKILETNAQRNIIANNNPDKLKFKLTTLKEVKENSGVIDNTGYGEGAAVLVLTDQVGNIVRFNEEGEVDADGSIPVYKFKEVTGEFKYQREAMIESWMQAGNVSRERVVEKVDAEIEAHVKNIKSAVSRMKEGETVYFPINIEESNLGFNEINDAIQTDINEIPNWHAQRFSIVPITKGASKTAGLTIPFSNKVFPLKPKTIDSLSETDTQNLESLLVNDTLTLQGQSTPIDGKTRMRLIETFIQVSKNINVPFEIYFGTEESANQIQTVKLNGVKYKLNDKRWKAPSKKIDAVKEFKVAFREFIGTYHAVPWGYGTPNNYKIVNSIDEVTFQGQVFNNNGTLMKAFKPEISFNLKPSVDLATGQITKVKSIQDGVIETDAYYVIAHVAHNSFTNIIPNEKGEIKGFSTYLAFNMAEDKASEDDTKARPDTFFRSIGENNRTDVLREGEEEAVDEWFERSGWSDTGLSVVLSDQVHERGPKFLASFLNGSVTLFKGSNKTDLYHEVFHAYSQGILSEEERNDMYNEIRRDHAGTSFTVTVMGKQKVIQVDNATDLEIEEWMAEEFREYARERSMYNKLPKSKVAAFFQRLLDFLKRLVGNKTYSEAVAMNKLSPEVQSLFKNIYEGKVDLAKYEAPANDVEYFQSYEVSEDIDLSYQEMHTVMTSMQALMASFIKHSVNTTSNPEANRKLSEYMVEMSRLNPLHPEYEKREEFLFNSMNYIINHNLEQGYNPKGTGMYIFDQDPSMLNSALTYIKNTFERKLAEFENVSGPVALENVVLLEKALKNFGDPTSSKDTFKGKKDSILSVFLNSYSTLNLNKTEFKEDEVAEANALEYKYDRTGAEQALRDVVDDRTKELLSTLFAYTRQGQGSMVVNTFGIAELVPFEVVLGKVARAIEGDFHREDMYDSLLKASKDDKIIAQLVERLGDPTNSDTTQLQTQWGNFWQSLNKATVRLRTTTIEKVDNKDEEEDSEVIIRSGRSTANISIIKSNWAFDFQMNAQEQSADIESAYTVLSNTPKPVLDPSQLVALHSDIKVFIPKGSQDLYHQEKQDFITYDRVQQSLFKADPAAFLRTIGINIPSTKKITQILNEGSQEYNIPPTMMSYIYRSLKRRENAVYPQDKYIKELKDIFKSFQFTDVVNDEEVNKTQEDLNGYFDILATFASEITDDYHTYMSWTPAGERQSEKSFLSSLSTEITLLNKAQSYEDVVSTPGLERFNIENDPFVAANKTYVQMFNLDQNPDLLGSKWGVRNNKISFTLETLVGSKIKYGQQEEGVKSIASDEKTKFISEFYNVLFGRQETPRNESKSTSPTVYGPIQKPGEAGLRTTLAVDNAEVNRMFTEEYEKDMTARGFILYNEFGGHIEAELIRMNRLNALQKRIDAGEDIVFDASYIERGQDFFFMDQLLSSGIKDELKKLKDHNASLTLSDKLSPELKKRIELSLRDYFELRGHQLFNEKNKDLIVGTNILEEFSLEEETEPETRQRMFNIVSINSYLQYINYTALFLGDPAIYNVVGEDFHKRIAGKISTGKTFLSDQSWYKFVNSQAFERDGFAKKHFESLSVEVKESKGLVEDFKARTYEGYLNTGIIKEAVSRSVYFKQYAELLGINNAESYAEMEEADGAGWISFDTYRLLAISSQEWSDGQEELYQRLLKGENINQLEIKNTFPIRKYQYYGPVMNELAQDVGLQPMAFHKYSLVPLIPGVIENTPLQKLHEMMMEQGIDYVGMQSTSKLSTLEKITPQGAQEDVVYDVNTETNERSMNDIKMTVNQIHVKHLKSQVFMSEGFKGYITLPSQMRKMIMLGLIENGVPTDFEVKGKSGSKTQWKGLKTESAKRKASKVYDWLVRYRDVVQEIREKTKTDLLEDIGLIETVDKDGNKSYTGSTKKLVNYIREELSNRDLLPEEVQGIIRSDGEMISDLSLNPNSAKIEEILVTLVDKKLRALKVNGEGLVQMTGAMTEYLQPDISSEEQKHENGTNGLRTYYLKNEDGTIATTKEGVKKVQFMEVKIALQGDFKNLLYLEYNGEPIIQYQRIKDKKTGKTHKKVDFNASLVKLNEALNDNAFFEEHKAKFTLSGPRIPTQAFASLEAAYVREFLPPMAGNRVVLPSEIVAKAGSDYDIDKLFLMFPNISKYSGGAVEMVKYDKGVQESRSELLEEIRLENLAISEAQKDLDAAYQAKREFIKNLDAAGEEGLKKSIDSYYEGNKLNYEERDRIDAIAKDVYTNESLDISERARIHREETSPAIDRLNEAISENIRDIKILEDQLFNKLIGLEGVPTVEENLKDYLKQQFKELNVDIDKAQSEVDKLLSKKETTERKLDSKSIKGLENNLLDLFAERITFPQSLKSLVEPNATDFFDDIAQTIGERLSKHRGYNKYQNGSTKVDKKTGKTVSIIAKSTIFDFRYNLLKHQENSVGLDALGVAAVTSTYYAIFTQMGAHLKGATSAEQARYKEALAIVTAPANTYPGEAVARAQKTISTYKDYTIKFDHNKVKVKGGMKISLGQINNVDEINISDIIGQLINGFVDVAKDPWIFNVQGTMENTPQLLFMVMAGVNVETAVNFVSLPMVMEYNQLKTEKKGVYSNINIQHGDSPIVSKGQVIKNSRAEMFDKYQQLLQEKFKRKFTPAEYNEVANMIDNISLADLKKYIESPGSVGEFMALAHYMQVEDMSMDLTKFTMATKWDTQKVRNISDAEQRIEQIKELTASENSIPSNVKNDGASWFEDIKDTPVGLFNNDQFILDLFSQYFGIRNNLVVVKKSNAVKSTEKTKGVPLTLLRTAYKNEFISFLYQNSLFKDNFYDGYLLEYSADEDVYVDIDKANEKVIYNLKHVKEAIEDEKGYLGNVFPTTNHFLRFEIERQKINEETKDMTLEEMRDKYYYVNNTGNKTLTKIGIINKLALYRSDNNVAMFDFQWGFASILKSITRKYPHLSDQFSLIHDMKYSYEASIRKANLFLQKLDDPTSVKRYRENLTALKNHPAEEVRDFFNRFDNMAILQTGMNRGSKYDLVRIIDQQKFINVIAEGLGVTQIIAQLDGASKQIRQGVAVKDVESHLLDVFNEQFKNILSDGGYFLRNRGVNYMVDGVGSREASAALTSLTDSNIRQYSSFVNLEGITTIEVDDLYTEEGELDYEKFQTLRDMKEFAILASRKFVAIEGTSQEELDVALHNLLGIDNTGDVPVVLGKSIGQTDANISIALAEDLKSKYSVKDEMMANLSTKAIGRGTEGHSPKYTSSSKSYADEINRLYPKKLAGNRVKFTSKDKVWVFGSGTGPIFSRAYKGVMSEDAWESTVQDTFDKYHKGHIDKAVKAGVKTFYVGDAQGVDQLAIDYLKSHGYYGIPRYTNTGKFFEFVIDYTVNGSELVQIGSASVSASDLGFAPVLKELDVKSKVNKMTEKALLSGEGYHVVSSELRAAIAKLKTLDRNAYNRMIESFVDSEGMPITVRKSTSIYDSFVERYLLEKRAGVIAHYRENQNAEMKRRQGILSHVKEEGVQELVIQQNFLDNSKYLDQSTNQWGIRTMQPKFAGKSTMDLIVSGDRTRTTRSKSEVARYLKARNLERVTGLIGQELFMTDKMGRKVKVRITNVAKFTQEYQDQTWEKEGWTKDVTDRLVGVYPYAIEFEVVSTEHLNQSDIDDLPTCKNK